MKPNLLMSLLFPIMPVWPAAERSTMNSPGENKYATIRVIPEPPGFSRIQEKDNSFGSWLRNLPLRKDKRVFLFNGQLSPNQDMQFAVLDLPLGNKNLQQCADAVIRLRAEYLKSQGRWNEIRFVDNNRTVYTPGRMLENKQWQNWLERVYVHCGTLSLQKQLSPVKTPNQHAIGAVLIQGGSPGHAMIIVDLAENKEGNRVCMLAQGYMPAQDIHIVVNPEFPGLSPWYKLDNGPLVTPGWSFPAGSLRKW